MKNEQIAKAKEQASRVAARLGEMGVEVKHSQALEVVAAVFGAENWHAYAAQLKKPQASSQVNQTADAPATGYSWFRIQLLAGMGSFRTDDLVLERTNEAAFAKAKAKYWDAAMESKFGSTLTSASTFIAPMATLQDIEQWLEDCAIDAEELDESVHDAMQEGGLDDLNALDDDDDQESHISSLEDAASDINNGGLSAQLAFLFQGYENDIPGFVSWLQDVLDLHNWHPKN